MNGLAEALKDAHYRPGVLVGEHCSNCAAYVPTTKAGEGRCAENDGAAVSFEGVCDKWKRRP